MLLYGRKAKPKEPKRRSRSGCIHCKEKKKKCNEARPQCDRCIEKNLDCEYEAIKPRKKRRLSESTARTLATPAWHSDTWTAGYADDYKQQEEVLYENRTSQKWETSPYEYIVEEDYAPIPLADIDDDIEEIIRSDTTTLSPMSRSSYMDLATIAPSPTASPLYEFSSPVFAEFTTLHNRRALVDHFCNVLSHLIVFKEDTGNPFRQLVLPLSHASSPVMNAIFALSSAHLEYRGVSNEERSLDFHNRALQGLAALIDKGDARNREVVLGAIMLLVYYEVLVQKGTSNIIQGHLKGALTIMQTSATASTPTTQFLERAFRFYDVISALSWGTSPISNTPQAMSPFSPPMEASTPFSSVDTLLGMATDLWPIIHRLSNLSEVQADLAEAEETGNSSKASVLRTELESTSSAIEMALKAWTPTPTTGTSIISTDNDDTTSQNPQLQSIFHNAEAYRQAAFIHLYRYVKSHARRSTKVQTHTKAALHACLKVVEWAGPMSALLWPLFVAACEAVDGGDKEGAREVFRRVEGRQGMTNIMRAWQVVEVVWERDDMGIEVCWKDVCTEKGFNIVFG